MVSRLFAYGTLQFPEVMERVLGEHLAGNQARLYGYESFQLKNYPFPGAVASKRSTVDGLVYSGITTKHLRLLDRYEGKIYFRKRVKVVLVDKHIQTAWVYLVSELHHKVLSNLPWNKQEFASKHLQRYLEKYC